MKKAVDESWKRDGESRASEVMGGADGGRSGNAGGGQDALLIEGGHLKCS